MGLVHDTAAHGGDARDCRHVGCSAICCPRLRSMTEDLSQSGRFICSRKSRMAWARLPVDLDLSLRFFESETVQYHFRDVLIISEMSWRASCCVQLGYMVCGDDLMMVAWDWGRKQRSAKLRWNLDCCAARQSGVGLIVTEVVTGSGGRPCRTDLRTST